MSQNNDGQPSNSSNFASCLARGRIQIRSPPPLGSAFFLAHHGHPWHIGLARHQRSGESHHPRSRSRGGLGGPREWPQQSLERHHAPPHSRRFPLCRAFLRAAPRKLVRKNHSDCDSSPGLKNGPKASPPCSGNFRAGGQQQARVQLSQMPGRAPLANTAPGASHCQVRSPAVDTRTLFHHLSSKPILPSCRPWPRRREPISHPTRPTAKLANPLQPNHVTPAPSFPTRQDEFGVVNSALATQGRALRAIPGPEATQIILPGARKAL